MSRHKLLMFAILVALLLCGCETVYYKKIYAPDYADTQTFQVTVPHSCVAAKQKAIATLRSGWINISQDAPSRITSTIQDYRGAEKGLLFKTLYTENLVYIFDFTQLESESRSCQVAMHGMVCERPDYASWECEKVEDFSRAEARLKQIIRQYEKEAL